MNWISVNHSLPPERKEVLIFNSGRIYMGWWKIQIPKLDSKGKPYKGRMSRIMWFEIADSCCGGDYEVKVTHWMHLPDEPEDDEPYISPKDIINELYKTSGVSTEMMNEVDSNKKNTIVSSSAKCTITTHTGEKEITINGQPIPILPPITKECWNHDCDCERKTPNKSQKSPYLQILKDIKYV